MEDEATRKLQRAWRRTLQPLSTRTYVEGFQRLNLGALPRRALLESIAAPRTASAMQLLLERLQRLCSIAMKQPLTPMPSGMVTTLKHAYISAAQPSPSKNGVSDQIAKTRRARLLQVFERIVPGLPALTAADATSFLASVSKYAQSMQQQKMQQLPEVTVQSQRVLLSLYGALEQLRDEPDHAETRIALREGIAHARAGLARLVPPGAMVRFEAERAGAATIRALQVHLRCQPMDNEAIGHELCLNPRFQLRADPPPPSAFDLRIRGITAEEATRLAIAEELQQTPPTYTRLLRAFSEIKSRLTGIIEPHLVVDLNAALDVDVIRADLARRGRVSDNIGRTVMRLAGGDAAGWNAVPADDAAAVAAFLLHRVQERCMDTANDRIRRIAPLFQTRSYEYERQKFQERVGDGLETPIARRWVQRPVGETAHARAFASLVAGAGALNLATLPETLVHDIDRVEGFRNEFAAILRAAFEAAVARRAAPGTPAFRALALVYAEPAHPAHRLLRGAMRRRFLRATPPLPAFVDAERFDALARDVEAVRALDFNVHSAAYH